ncbi:hypothetical protein BXZ70DRAFT_929163 [Cristinia sonorae]|uniref:ER membrane protein complex subunit 7 beta-sandwich domain-containing protein n=1 Tax=Cristinia sonorae TaxID=1940300 RepID=A0A8K0UT61_9AGAR|nr:hypothetical protein BXZ70DRAFT_929163 [Cristinia sonorae]
MRLPFSLLVLASSICSTVALDLKGRILWNDKCTSLEDLGQARVVLDDGRLHGGVTADGGFTIPAVPPGAYILSVVAHDHAFDTLRIDVLESDTLPEVRAYMPGTPLSPPSPKTLSYPITLQSKGKYDFYIPRQSFNILGMFQNPMMLMMGFTGIMVLAMPYIMKTMDSDTLQDFSKRQSRIAEVQNAFSSGDLKTGWSALMSGMEEADAAASGSGAAPKPNNPTGGVKNRGPKNKRR